MSLLSFIENAFKKVESFFASGKAVQVETELAGLVQLALPIVQDIAAMTPNKTVQQISDAYTKYGVPLAQQVASDPTSTGNALLNLATAVLQKNHAPVAAVSLLNTAVQMALLVSKHSAAPAA